MSQFYVFEIQILECYHARVFLHINVCLVIFFLFDIMI